MVGRSHSAFLPGKTSSLPYCFASKRFGKGVRRESNAVTDTRVVSPPAS